MIRLNGKKEQSLISWAIAPAKIPSKVRIVIPPSVAGSVEFCARPGEFVKTGQVIAKPTTENGVCLHASISGSIQGKVTFIHPVHGPLEALEILSDKNDEWLSSIGTERRKHQDLTRHEMLKILAASGVLMLEGERGPLHVELRDQPCPESGILILNGCECEPYVTSTQSLVMSHSLEILKGAELIRKMYGAAQVVIVMEKQQAEAVELVKSKIYLMKWEHFRIQPLESLWPQDHPAFLRQAVLKNEKKTDIETRLQTMATAFAVYEAIVKQKPLIERAVTIAGECVAEPKNIWVRMGTSFEDAFKACKGLLRDPLKLIEGGPMQGFAHENLSASMLPSAPALLALPKEVAADVSPLPCIQCGRCVSVCPVKLHPAIMTQASENRDFKRARAWGVDRCIECGNCAYVCPSKRPMIDLIRKAAGRI